MKMEKASDTIKIEGIDFKETKDKFTIFNVPIMAELVQPYGSKMAFKSKDEIAKVDVQNVPLTMCADEPSHPERFLGDVPSDMVADVTVGFMRNPTRQKKKLDERKRYVDMILFKNDLTSKVIDAYKNGQIVDTSIGFTFDIDMTPGEHEGVKYDYVQRNIKLDHNAILMDAMGNIGTGRMPSPIGGIGADSSDKNLGGDKMAKDEEAPAPVAEEPKIEPTPTVEEPKQEVAPVEEPKTEEEPVKTDSAETDELKKSNDALKVEIDSLKAELKTRDEAIAGYVAKEKAVIDSMRQELVKANPEMDKLFESANDDLIKEYHAKLKAKTPSRDIGADMMRTTKTPTPEAKSTEEWVKQAQPKK